jgi:hypothetical protein
MLYALKQRARKALYPRSSSRELLDPYPPMQARLTKKIVRISG